MEQTKNILVLCTGNSARSVIGECLINHLSKGRYMAYSAGSKPKGEAHPMALKVLNKRGIDTSAVRSKSWDEFATPDAPKMDLVITVCGNARDEVCPVWPGVPLKAHWGLDDPAAFEGSEVMMEAAFDTAFGILQRRVKAFLAHEDMPTDPKVLSEIGQLP